MATMAKWARLDFDGVMTTVLQMWDAVRLSNKDKFPGLDGLPAEFYEAFSAVLATAFHAYPERKDDFPLLPSVAKMSQVSGMRKGNCIRSMNSPRQRYSIDELTPATIFDR